MCEFRAGGTGPVPEFFVGGFHPLAFFPPVPGVLLVLTAQLCGSALMI
jgi:hypothetical protein